MRLVVTGGRDYSDTARAFAALDELHARKPVAVLIQGEARGLDARKELGIPSRHTLRKLRSAVG